MTSFAWKERGVRKTSVPCSSPQISILQAIELSISIELRGEIQLLNISRSMNGCLLTLPNKNAPVVLYLVIQIISNDKVPKAFN